MKPGPITTRSARNQGAPRAEVRNPGPLRENHAINEGKRLRHSIGNTGQQKNGTPTLDLVELKDMSIQSS